mmetsp:Transcript_17259/g.49301  ORF Transcript_17259/g.49301 Transcript_17259/m.49301 type:complete len:205 (-) Transcript_17259:871-1485(-)
MAARLMYANASQMLEAADASRRAGMASVTSAQPGGGSRRDNRAAQKPQRGRGSANPGTLDMASCRCREFSSLYIYRAGTGRGDPPGEAWFASPRSKAPVMVPAAGQETLDDSLSGDFFIRRRLGACSPPLSGEPASSSWPSAFPSASSSASSTALFLLAPRPLPLPRPPPLPGRDAGASAPASSAIARDGSSAMPGGAPRSKEL